MLPTIALRADAGFAVGLGHLRRVDALAARLADWARCLLLVDDEPPVAIATPWRRIDPDGEATLAAAVASGARAIVVDSYTLTISSSDVHAAGIPILVRLEDEGRLADADVVVSPGLDETQGRYAGPRYALLAPQFEAAPMRKWSSTVDRALLVLGGAPPVDLIAALAASVRRALPTAAIDLVAGTAAASADAIARATQSLGRVSVHVAVPDLRPLMLAADVAVSGGGVTLFELAACATPTVAVLLAPNQRPNIARLVEGEAVLAAGDGSSNATPAAIEAAVRALVGDAGRRRALGEAARRIVDGGGARRLSELLRARLTRAAAREVVPC